MSSSPSIPRDPPANPAQDYAALLALGLDYCQRLTEDTWTDYNEHDPGVTILEQLCYALTDLGLRNSQPVPVLLAPAPGTTAAADTLISGERILSSAPWTVADYRRMLYDRVVHLKNAWLAAPGDAVAGQGPAAASKASDAYAWSMGLYEVRVESFIEDIKSDDERAALIESVVRQMRAQRNLGEDLASVVLLQPHAIEVHALIEVGINADPVGVLAQVLFDLQHFLVPFPRVELADALLQAGMPPDEIFRGPRLGLGVIGESGLANYRRDVTRQQVIDIILAVPGVRRVSKVSLAGVGLNAAGDAIALQPNEVPRLAPSIFEPPTRRPYTIQLELEGGIAQSVDSARVYSRIEALIAALTDQQNYAELQTRALGYGRAATASYVDLPHYTSIQHQFPMTYGIGREGVPALPHWSVESAGGRLQGSVPVTSDRRRRQALAQQLKGYLLLFEQLLANQFAQLANAWQLFALELGPPAQHSYFWQPLVHTPELDTDPPDVLALLTQRTGPDGTEQMQHGVYVIDAERRVVLVGRETGNLSDAHAVRAELVRRGAAANAYQIERIAQPELSGQAEFRLTIHAADGNLLAYGEERYGTLERAQFALTRMAALLARCVDDPAQTARHLIVRALSGITVRIADRGGRIVLDSGALPDAQARTRRERDLLLHGVEPSRYRVRRDDRGWLRLTLHDAQHELLASGEIRYASLESARLGRDELVAWVVRLRDEPSLHDAYIEASPAVPGKTLPGAYLAGLAELNARFDPAVERRNRFLDHLLARFGERFEDSLLARLDPRDDGGTALQIGLQRAKTLFLRNLVPLGAGRATGPDYGRALTKSDYGPGGQEDEPADGFVRRLALLLGIEVPADADGVLRSAHFRMTRENPPFLYVEREEGAGARVPPANQRSFTFHAKQPAIIASLLEHGLTPEHYSVRHDAHAQYGVSHDGSGSWVLTFAWPGDKPQDIHRAGSREAIHAARDRLMHYLRGLSHDARALQSGEGFHMVEHILLRPDQLSADDGFYRQRVSLFFPNWPVRFQDPEFRAFAQRTVFDNTPVHLDVRCYWLGFGEMTEFERLDGVWRSDLHRFANQSQGERPGGTARAMRAFIERMDLRDREEGDDAAEGGVHDEPGMRRRHGGNHGAGK